MALQITLTTVEAVYDMLRTTRPFNRWRMPDADSIGFAVMRNPTSKGEFYVDAKGHPVIAINDKYHHTIDELMRTVSHEMCHLREYLHGPRKDVHHGAWFKRSARAVCKAHNFDEGAF